MRIELDGISKRYGDRFVVSDAKLSVRSGELIGLLGPSGCGKSTLLTVLAGLVVPDAGIVRLDDRVASDPRIRVPPSQRSIGMVFQDLALWPHMTVERHLRFVAPKVDPRPILEAVEIAHLASARPATLSGGEAQRVAIARALATRPSILLLDEPLGPLDRRLKAKILDLISDLHRRFGTTTIHVTHDYEEAFRLADRVAIMSEGRIVQTGTPDEIYRRPTGVEAAELSGPVSFLPGTGGPDGTVTTSLGPLRTHPGAPTGGDGMLVVVRPDRVAVEPAESGCAVESAHDTGTRWELRIRTKDGILSALSPTRLEPGTRVAVSLSEPVWTVLK
jgi:ABC-type Fe3+/spermidine/putrescine transport system ATPase subunit